VITGITQLPPDGGATADAFGSVQVGFSEALDGISARSPANYELLFAGSDGVFGSPDDTRIAISPEYSTLGASVTLHFQDGVLSDGLYRLRLSGTLGLFDTAGNLLDGNGDGTPGGDYVRTFTIDRTSNQAPTAANAVSSSATDDTVTTAQINAGTSGEANAYSVLGQLQVGKLSGNGPDVPMVTHAPTVNFNGNNVDLSAPVSVRPVRITTAVTAAVSAIDESTSALINPLTTNELTIHGDRGGERASVKGVENETGSRSSSSVDALAAECAQYTTPNYDISSIASIGVLSKDSIRANAFDQSKKLLTDENSAVIAPPLSQPNAAIAAKPPGVAQRNVDGYLLQPPLASPDLGDPACNSLGTPSAQPRDKRKMPVVALGQLAKGFVLSHKSNDIWLTDLVANTPTNVSKANSWTLIERLPAVH
jgi:hypothetical protein